jgi:alkaline phosphatase
MYYRLLWVLLALCGIQGHAQQYTSSSVFAHNDYVQPIPFYAAYQLQVGYIEADIFLQNGKLLVAHTQAEIDPTNTLDSLYLKPLLKRININGGYAYKDIKKSLSLMIDLKTEGLATLHALVKLLEHYPKLTAAKNFEIVISGNVPEPARWAEFPSFIHFDGRPGKLYTTEQLARVSLISTSFTQYSRWNGKGVLSALDLQKIQQVKSEARAIGKKLRFWAAPDFENAWIQLMKLNVDVIGSDQVSNLITFICNTKKHVYK